MFIVRRFRVQFNIAEEELFRQGDFSQKIYMVTAGSVKLLMKVYKQSQEVE